MSDIKIISEVWRDSYCKINRAEQAGILFLLKSPVNYYADDAKERLMHEYAIMLKANPLNEVKLVQSEKNNLGGIAMKDFNGSTLESFIYTGKMTLKAFLKIAIQVTAQVEILHENNILYNNLTPGKILINEETQEIRFIDYSSCQSFLQGAEGKSNIKDFGLDYISPEQTGKLNQSVDYRSDLYSLGVIFYEMLASKKLFNCSDANQLIHYHVARIPVPLYITDPKIPVTVSNIVSTLLSKNVQQRYQSAYGLKTDLQKCLNDLSTAGKVLPFQLAQQDFFKKVQLPKTIYGRSSELSKLEEAFESVSEGNSAFVLVAGESGIGKSALIQEFNKSIAGHNGYFVSGKFNQHHNLPYQAFIEALKQLVDFIIAGDQESLHHWQHIIKEAIGENGKILTDVIPNLESLIGPQMEAELLPPLEAQNRFNFLLGNFFKVLGTKQQPLIFFIDDLHWADAASAGLLKVLLTDKGIKHLLIVSSIRDNELREDSPVALVLNDIKVADIAYKNIKLQNLSFRDIAWMLSECLSIPYDVVQEFAFLVFSKTEGNPFFTLEFLKSLDEKGLLHFNYNTCRWEWKYKEIKQLYISENRVELVNERIKKLKEDTLNILQVAACLGNTFMPGTLSFLLGKSKEAIAEGMKDAMTKGIVFEDQGMYKYAHDKLHQAVYASISEKEIQHIHLEIGRKLSENLTENENALFNIAIHFHKALSLIEDEAEKIKIAEIFYLAGLKAKKASAFASSYEYFKDGLSLLADNHWASAYDFSLKLYTEASESAYMEANHELMEQLTQSVIDHSKSVLERVKAYEIRIRAYTAQGKFGEAVKIALEVLELLGVTFPENPSKFHVIVYLAQTKIYLRGRKIENLAAEPMVSNPYISAALRIISNVGSAAYFAHQDLFPLLVLRSFNLMLRYGNSKYSAFITASYGLIVSAGLQDYATAGKVVALTKKYLQNSSSRHYAPRTTFMVSTFFAHAIGHIKNTIGPLKDSYNNALKEGDVEYAAYSALIINYNEFFAGISLNQLVPSMVSRTEAIRKLNQEAPLYSSYFYTQAAYNLHHIAPKPYEMVGPIFDEQLIDPLHTHTIASISSIFDYCLCKVMLSYLFDETDSGLHFSNRAEFFIENSLGTSVIPTFYFFQSLTYIRALKKGKSVADKKRLMKKVKKNQAQLKFMAKHAPMNFMHKYLLVEAELFRFYGKQEKAIACYNEALKLAGRHQYINDEALISETIADFHLEHHDKYLAEFYLNKALDLYRIWGAYAKTNHLKERYPDLNGKTSESGNSYDVDFISDKKSGLPETISSSFDLKSIMKAAMAISANLDLEKLLVQLIQISFEYANADKGFLILKRNEEFFIEAEGNINEDFVRVLQSIPCNETELVPESILQFVSMTSENLVIQNALKDPKFSMDPIVIKNQSKSVLCIPITRYGVLVGILYLENSLIANAFAEERINILKLLSGQMAVSIENALDNKKKTDVFAEKELKLKHKSFRQNIISREIIKTQEYERKRIAEELHDGMGYLLSTLKLNLTALKEERQAHAGEPQEFLENSLSLLEDSFKELRSISNNLMPDFLHQYGLLKGLEELCNKIRATGRIDITYKHFNIEGKFTKVSEIEIFRVLQELINNVLKHAHASLIELQIIRQGQVLVITLDDDGKGFNYEEKVKDKSGGRGLLNIINRVRFLKGSVNFESSPKGTIVIIRLPIKGLLTKNIEHYD
jgi:histidine kinase